MRARTAAAFFAASSSLPTLTIALALLRHGRHFDQDLAERDRRRFENSF